VSEADPKSEDSAQSYLETFKKSPISHSLFWTSLVFSLGGFVYNNLQNPNRLFTGDCLTEIESRGDGSSMVLLRMSDLVAIFDS
jgi:hypothetical protein